MAVLTGLVTKKHNGTLMSSMLNAAPRSIFWRSNTHPPQRICFFILFYALIANKVCGCVNKGVGLLSTTAKLSPFSLGAVLWSFCAKRFWPDAVKCIRYPSTDTQSCLIKLLDQSISALIFFFPSLKCHLFSMTHAKPKQPQLYSLGYL